jgi:diguanylate cyclase (GGDEF)-like protein/PAS domain S-box-containing protein
VDQGRTPSENQHTLGNERTHEPLEHGGLSRRVAPFAVAAVAVAALVALIAGAAGYSRGGEALIAVALVSLIIAAAVGLAIHRLVRELHARAVEYRSIVETALESFISTDADGRILQWNRQAERDFGWSRDEVIGRGLAEIVVPPQLRDAYGEGISRFLRAGESTHLSRRLELQALHRDGHEFPVEVTISALRTADGHRFNAFLHDISQRQRSERALREAEEKFRRAFHDTVMGMAIVSLDGKWLQANQALAELTGYPTDQLIGMSFRELTHPDDLDTEVEALNQLVAGRRERYVTEKRYMRADGSVIWISLSVSPVRDDDGAVLYLISQMQDITERKQTEAKLAHQAMHDPLTGAPNRILFTDRLLLAKARLMRGGSLAVLFCDLDRFKVVNDDFGHDAGDRLLIEAAARLRSTLRPSDTVARFGGDEFALLCEGVDLRSVERIASRIEGAFSAPFLIGGHEISVTTSIGIMLTSDPDVSPDQLVSDADFAMYAAKQDGRARHVVFGRHLRQPPAFTSERRRSDRTANRAVRPSSHS